MSSDEVFTVRVGEVEGPLELILNLIERRKLHISDVSLAAIADGYVEQLSKLDQSKIAIMANFILVASTLMLIKSLALLPNIELSADEQADIVELKRRLLVYECLQKQSATIRALGKENKILLRSAEAKLSPVFAPDRTATRERLGQIMRDLITALPTPEILPQIIVKKILSLEEIITDLAGRVSRALKISFRDFVADKREKTNIIVSFLGMLELVRRGLVEVAQDRPFHDISIETVTPAVPHYD
ncbi:MAG: ScpA family protein [Patescibacteria group bacterium]